MVFVNTDKNIFVLKNLFYFLVLQLLFVEIIAVILPLVNYVSFF